MSPSRAETPPSVSPRPHDGGIRKQLFVIFLVCLGCYAVWFAGIEAWRKRRGPWEVTFTADSSRQALLEVSQPRLRVQRFQILFRGAAVPPDFVPRTVRFDAPQTQALIPFGSVRFLDTTFLPGTVTFDLFGHEVELLPRVLIVDKTEHSWTSTQRLEVE